MGKFKNPSFYIREIAGSLGDLPLFFIFFVGLTQLCHMNSLSMLFWSGIAHIFVGIIFKIPLSYQPMKALGLYALSHSLSQSEILAAGILSALIILALNFAGLFQKLYDIFPQAIIRGIQLGLAISLSQKAYNLTITNSEGFPIFSLLVVAAFAFLILFNSQWHYLLTLLIFSVGLGFLFSKDLVEIPSLKFSLDLFENHLFSLKWTKAVLTLTLLQIPLTLANSIFSPALLIKDYFPERQIKASDIAWSVGLMNLLTCPFGGMPACHGAGGLAAQYRFGARSGFSIIFLGCLKVFSALFVGTFFLKTAQQFPQALLGLLFIFPAIDLGSRALNQKGKRHHMVLGITCLTYLLWNPGWALVSGLSYHSFICYLKKRGISYV